MTEQVRITVLVENTVYERGLLAGTGLAYWIESARSTSCSTPNRGAYWQATPLRWAPLSHVDAVVLSHGHFDHTGTLAESLQSRAVRDDLCPSAAARNQSSPGTRTASRTRLAFPSCKQAVQQRATNGTHREAHACRGRPDGDGNRAPGDGPEDTGRPFFLDAACPVRDR